MDTTNETTIELTEPTDRCPNCNSINVRFLNESLWLIHFACRDCEQHFTIKTEFHKMRDKGDRSFDDYNTYHLGMTDALTNAAEHIAKRGDPVIVTSASGFTDLVNEISDARLTRKVLERWLEQRGYVLQVERRSENVHFLKTENQREFNWYVRRVGESGTESGPFVAYPDALEWVLGKLKGQG